MLKVDVWSDFACPFCYIGKRNLESAIYKLQISKEVEIIFHSFQLDPGAEKSNKFNLIDILSEKYRISKKEAEKAINRVVDMAKDVGLDYNYDKVIDTNTFDAHRLVHYGKENNKEIEIIEKLFQGYFTDGLDIGSLQTLSKISKDVGLDGDKTLKILNGNQYKSKVEEDKYLAQEMGITSVPFFIINNKTAIPGAQDSSVFLEVLNDLISK